MQAEAGTHPCSVLKRHEQAQLSASHVSLTQYREEVQLQPACSCNISSSGLVLCFLDLLFDLLRQYTPEYIESDDENDCSINEGTSKHYDVVSFVFSVCTQDSMVSSNDTEWLLSSSLDLFAC